MNFGFSLVLEFNAKEDSMDICMSKFGYECLSPHPKVKIYYASNKDYVQHVVRGEWIVLSKGKTYMEEPLAECIFNNIQNCTEENIESIVSNLKKIAGQYCYICLNVSSGLLISASDPSGLYSLFETATQDCKVICSNLPFIYNFISKDKLIADKKNQSFLLRYGYSLEGHTVYKDVNEIVPRKISVRKNYLNCKARSVTEKYEFDMGVDDSNHTHDDKEKELYKCFKKVCAQQVGDAKKVGVLLGGFDSALIASILCSMGLTVETYSFYYRDESYNQPLVEQLSSYLGVKHNWIEITPDIIQAALKKYEQHNNSPTLWLNYIIQTQYILEKMVCSGVEVCFSGDGCDSAFMGYPSTHRRGNVYKNLPKISAGFANAVSGLAYKIKLEYFLGHIARVIQSLIDASKYDVSKRPLYSFQVFGPNSIKHLKNGKSDEESSYIEHFKILSEKLNQLSYERRIYHCKSLISPNREKIVSSSDGSGIVISSPYLHPDIISMASAFPDELLRSDNTEDSRDGKYILMKMAEKFSLLPSEIIYQPKLAAIKSPIDYWIADELKNTVSEIINHLPFSYNSKYVNSLLINHKAEELYKKHFSNDGVVSIAASLLTTYASFFK